MTPLLSREEAEQYGQISGAEVGLTRLSGGRKFADEFFDPKKALYEPEELTDLLGTRFLARKIKDVPPHVPSLDEVRSEVASPGRWTRLAPWPRRPPNSWPSSSRRRAARSRTARSRDIRVVTIPAIARKFTPFESLADPYPAWSEPEETPIPDVAYAGRGVPQGLLRPPAGLGRRRPQPARDVYYVMMLDRREPATFAALYAPNGDEFRYKMFATRTGGPPARGPLDGLAATTSRPRARLGARRRGQGEGSGEQPELRGSGIGRRLERRHSMSTIAPTRSTSPTPLADPPAPGLAPSEIYRFTVDQYERMGEAGILTEDDPVELIDGLVVTKIGQGAGARLGRRIRRRPS